MDERLRSQWKRMRTKLLARRDALMAEVREIDQMIGAPIAGPRGADNGGMCESLRQLVRNAPGQTVRDLADASGIRPNRAHSLLFHMDARGTLRIDRSVKPHRVYPVTERAKPAHPRHTIPACEETPSEIAAPAGEERAS